MYECESWNVCKIYKYIDTIKMWIWKRIKKISWVMEGVGWIYEYKTYNGSRKRAMFIGHLLRNMKFVANIIEGRYFVKKKRKAPKKILSCVLIGKHYYIKGAALDRREWLWLQGIAISVWWTKFKYHYISLLIIRLIFTQVKSVDHKQNDIHISSQQFYGWYFCHSNILSLDLIFHNSFLVYSYEHPTDEQLHQDLLI